MSVFSRTHALDSGPRVRLRLARAGDRAAVAELLALRGVEADELELRRLLAYDPVRRRVMTAFALIDGVDTLVGLAAIDLDEDADIDTLVVDERLTEGLGELLASTLRHRARRAA